MEQSAEEIKSLVKKRYASLAKEKSGPCCAPEAAMSPGCCNTSAAPCQTQTIAERLYNSDELEQLPGEVTDISLGCGNPTAIAELSEGEVVLDLGSGGGIDCFLSAQKVGTQGKVIGLDMTQEMIQLARENAQKIGASNVEFRLGEMEHMPVADNSVDVIISNCVINLSPDKDAVFKESYRVLKPGGRLCVSDIVLLGELAPEIKNDLSNWVSCIAGALPQDKYLGKIRAAGFKKMELVDTTEWIPERRPPETQKALTGKLASLKIKAFKPGKA
ncbi:arsenite methyltransferase [Chloroflexota bacterium]